MTTAKHPCSCCGHLSLPSAGDYELCPVCSWEDDGVALRWPMTADDGPNGITLVEGQQRYRRSGIVAEHMRPHVRRPRADEPLDEGWRPFDPAVDWTVPELDGERCPWNRDALYYWRDTYWNGVVDRLPAPPREVTGGDRLVDHLRATLPESVALIGAHEWERGRAAPMAVARDLADLAVRAYRTGDPDLGLRIVTALAPGLDEDGDTYAPNVVGIAFLERDAWHEPAMQPFIDGWPDAVRDDVRRQQAHVDEAARRSTSTSCGRRPSWHGP